MLSKALKDGNKDGIEMAWGDRIEEGADVIITGIFVTPNSVWALLQPLCF